MNFDSITILPHANENPNRLRTFTVTFFGDPITTTVTATPSVVREWLFRFRRPFGIRRERLVVGLGVQWNPFSSIRPHVAATLHLCIGRQCLIFQLLHATHVPNMLRRFLADPLITFVGVWNQSDEALLLRSNHRLLVSRLVDVRHVAAERRGLSSQSSMTELAEILLNANEVKKYTRIEASNWDADCLSFDQVQYACVDAFISFALGKSLKVWNWDRNE